MESSGRFGLWQYSLSRSRDREARTYIEYDEIDVSSVENEAPTTNEVTGSEFKILIFKRKKARKILFISLTMTTTMKDITPDPEFPNIAVPTNIPEAAVDAVRSAYKKTVDDARVARDVAAKNSAAKKVKIEKVRCPILVYDLH